MRSGTVAVFLALSTAAACATKSDIRMLQDDIGELRVRQDSLIRETQRQTRLVLDTLRTSFAVQQDVRGETSHRFAQLEQNLGRLEEIINQTQLLIAQLNDRLDRQTAISPGLSPGGPVSTGEAEVMYTTALQKMSEGSYATARAAFEQIVEQYPNDPRAPDAQFQLAETYVQEQNFDRAVEALEKLERQWSRSARAPEALLRAGVIEQDRNQRSRARQFYQQVNQRYPGSEAAREATRRLREIR
jgi:tol-pal system protein YbgF